MWQALESDLASAVASSREKAKKKRRIPGQVGDVLEDVATAKGFSREFKGLARKRIGEGISSAVKGIGSFFGF
jgi:hypothetical protein